MHTTNIFIIDDHRLIAGSLGRYLQNRFGRRIHIETFFNAETPERLIEDNSLVMILDYPLNGKGHGRDKVKVLQAIKEHNPNAGVVILPAPDDMETDIVKMVKTMGKDASLSIVNNERDPVKKLVAQAHKTFIQPARAIVQEHSVGEFLGLFFIAYAAIGAAVLLVLFLVKLYQY